MNGQKYNGRVTYTERNWYRNVLYYVAVLDCEDDLYKSLGNSGRKELLLKLEMTADDNHISYEK